MKNYVMTGAAVLSAFLFLGCGGQNKQNTEKEMYGAQNETYIEGWEKKTSNLLIYKRLCKI